ncbi:MAG: CBS domain-containing protein [Paracoccaceae bacterium]
MLVRQMLALKQSQEVTTISPSASASDAAGELSVRRIGCLVVSDDGTTVVGMLSERDIVRELGKRGSGCLSDHVRDIMSSDIETCTQSETADEVLRKMTDRRARHLPVIEDGKLKGLISIGDVVFAKLSEMTMEKEALEGMIKGF